MFRPFRAWFMQTVDKLMADLASAHNVVLDERSARLELERRCASQQATIEWLSAELTQTRMERAALVERAFNVTLPVPVVAYQRPEDVQADPKISPETLAALAGSAPMPRNAPNGSEAPASALIESLERFGVSFDDPGDAAAATLGYGARDEGASA